MRDVKHRFLSSEATRGHPVRETILSSWRRSKFWGVSTEHLEPPYTEELELENRLAAAARPVLDHLQGRLAGTAMSIILTNARGQVLQRRTGEHSLQRRLDAIRLAPGFSYAEEHVGTNGIGSAIESRQPFFVEANEHFSDTLGIMSCAGAPIMDPVTGRMQGVIDLTCRAEDANSLMKVLAAEAAAEITHGLVELSSAAERALLQEFLAASHTSNRAVVAVSADLYMSNAMAAGLLDRADHLLVKDRATELIGGGGTVTEVLLSNGDTASLKARAVGDERESPGLIVELAVAETRSRGGSAGPALHPVAVPGMAARSGSWAVTEERAEACRREGVCLLAVGEAGTGKLALIRAVHQRGDGAGALQVIDAGELGTEPDALPPELDRLVRTEIGTVVLRHLDVLPAPVWPAVCDWIDRRRDRGRLWVTGTVRTADHDTGYGEAVRGLAVVVEVPALRYRVDDIRGLVPVLLDRLAPHGGVRVGPAAMQTLLRHPWPENVTELESVLQQALTRRPRGEITPGDLPEMVHSTSRQVLSPWDSMERDLITRALIESRGDKVRAASELGISRATIYRKIRAFGIVLADPDGG